MKDTIGMIAESEKEVEYAAREMEYLIRWVWWCGVCGLEWGGLVGSCRNRLQTSFQEREKSDRGV